MERFEGMVANATGVSQAVAVSSGTSGLHAALVAVGVGRDDLVVLPSFTFIASANAIAYCGASPWLFDVTAESWTLDPALLTKHFETETYQKNGRLIHKETGRRGAAVMPVYTFGMPADMDAIVKIANDYNLPVIADGAAALGATYKGRLSGNLGADLTIYSFNGNKTVTTGGGGAVVGEKVDLVKLVRHLTTTAKVGDGYHHDRIGFNYRMTNIAAAVGCAQMELLEKFVSAKRRIQENYNSALKSFPGVDIFPQPEWAEGACWLSGITMPDLESAKALRDRLKENNIDARPFWKSIHLQSMFLDSPRTAQAFSSEIWSRIVTLPCSSGLIEADQLKVISTIQKLLS